MYKKIDAFKNGAYFCSTNKYKTCKAFKAALVAEKEIIVVGRELHQSSNIVNVENCKITANFA